MESARQGSDATKRQARTNEARMGISWGLENGHETKNEKGKRKNEKTARRGNHLRAGPFVFLFRFYFFIFRFVAVYSFACRLATSASFSASFAAAFSLWSTSAFFSFWSSSP